MIRDEKAVPCQVCLHHAECAITVFHPVLERMALQLTAALDQREPEIGRADVWLETVLLEEHPLQRLRPRDAVFRRKRRSAGNVPQNGIGLGEMTIRRDLKQRHLTVWIFREEFGCAALALEDVDLDESVRNPEPRQRKADLVAVARALHRVERVHSDPGLLRMPAPAASLFIRTKKVRQLQGRETLGV